MAVRRQRVMIGSVLLRKVMLVRWNSIAYSGPMLTGGNRVKNDELHGVKIRRLGISSQMKCSDVDS